MYLLKHVHKDIIQVYTRVLVFFVEIGVVTFVLGQFKSKSRVILHSQSVEEHLKHSCSKIV